MIRSRKTVGEGRYAPEERIGTIQNPLDHLAADHSAERDTCALLERIARADGPLPGMADRVLSFLLEVYHTHLLDEEEDLFPLLRQRCEAEYEINRVLRLLEADHHHPQTDREPIIAILEASMAKHGIIPADHRKKMVEFADHSRRHLTLENAIVLPIARARLTKADLAGLRQHMIQRRSLVGGDDAR